MSDEVYERRLSAFEGRIGYVFKDKSLALMALTHASYGEGQRAYQNNEKLEFLGDRVLGLLTARQLYHEPSENEGQLARHLNALVCKETCARVAQKIGLGSALRMSPAEQKQGGCEKISILGNACESLLAALFLDGGLQAANDFFDRFWAQERKAIVGESMKDPKTRLQERALAKGLAIPTYEIVKRTGPDHNPHFVICVHVASLGSAKGQGSSKKQAERDAAHQLLEIIDRTG